MRLEGTDIEGYLQHQHDMIILTAIEEARQGAEDHVQEMQRRYACWCALGGCCDILIDCFSVTDGQRPNGPKLNTNSWRAWAIVLIVGRVSHLQLPAEILLSFLHRARHSRRIVHGQIYSVR